MSQTGVRLLLTAVLCLLVAYGDASAQSSEALIEQYSQQGQKALADGRYAEAETAFEKLRELEPEVAEVYANLGLTYFQERKFQQAVPALRHALKLNPALPKLDTLLAMSRSELGQYNEALPALEKGFHRSTDPVIKRMCGLQLERAYTGLRRDSNAVEVALELNRLYPDDPEILYENGKIFGNFAFLNMQKLAEVAPSSVWRHQAAAEAQESRGAYVLAITEYQRVLEFDPHRPGIHYRLGRTLLALSRNSTSPNDVADAAKEFEKELRLDPTNANAAYELGEINREAGKMSEAQQFFEAALKNYPDFEEAHVGLAAILVALEKPAEALPHLQKAIASNPADDVAWYRLSQVERGLGNIAEEKKALAEFGKLHEKSLRKRGLGPIFSPREVTKQEVDPGAVSDP